MNIGCFALVEPFAPLARQFKALREMGIDYADLTDSHNGGSLGVEYGFTASVSLDTHPAKIRAMACEAGITLTSVCAHANLLDPISPDIYSTFEIIKAIRLAASLGIRHVITTEGDPKTEFGHSLTPDQRIFAIRERLYTPILWAEELGVELLLESHGIVTDNVDAMAELLDCLGHPDTIGICLDTGNSWLGGSDPVDHIRRFPGRIKHVHWKDMPASCEAIRGKQFGCGMSTIPLGSGVVHLRGVVRALVEDGFDGDTTLEIAGAENVKCSLERLKSWIVEAQSAQYSRVPNSSF
jgi:inosose dehydratase